MNNIDNCIKLNVKMILGELGAAAFATAAMILSGTSFQMAIVGLILVVAILFIMFRAYKKLYWTSLYGNTAYMYNSLPFTAEELVVGKVFAATLIPMTMALTAGIVSVIMIFVGSGGMTALFTGYWPGDITLSQFSSVYLSQPGMCVLIPLMVTGSVFTALLILFAVAYANSYEVKEQKTPRFVSAVIIYGVTSAVVGSGISRVTEALGMEYALWMSLAQMLINVIATVVLFKITVKLLKRSYLVQ